jgi:hypothetical protein
MLISNPLNKLQEISREKVIYERSDGKIIAMYKSFWSITFLAEHF